MNARRNPFHVEIQGEDSTAVAQRSGGEKTGGQRRWRAALCLGLASLLLAGDYLTGPFVSFSLLFVIPVVLAARWSGRSWGITLAVLLPLAHLGFEFVWRVPWSLMDGLANFSIRLCALAGFALLVDRVTRQEHELRVLRGLLPICGFCKRIRNANQQWQQLEVYIVRHSEARFTHSVCPECAREHYPEYCDDMEPDADPAVRSLPPGSRPARGTWSRSVAQQPSCPDASPGTKQTGTAPKQTEKGMVGLKAVTHDADEPFSATAGEAREKIGAVRSRSAAVNAVRAACHRLGENTLETVKTTGKRIREHPYETTGVAFGIGVAIGVLF